MALRYLGQSLRTDLEFIQKGVARAAPHILWFALGDPLAWDIQGTPAQVAAFNKAILAEDFFGFQYLDKMVGLKRGSVERFLVRTDTSDVLTSNLEDILIGDRPPLGGIVLDLMAAGKELREKAKRPLIIVSDIEILDQPAPTSATRGARSTRR